MRIIIDIPVEVKDALSTHISRALVVKTVDGKATNVPQFDSIDAFLESVLTPVFDFVMKEYPSTIVTAKLAELKRVEEELGALSRAIVTSE